MPPRMLSRYKVPSALVKVAGWNSSSGSGGDGFEDLGVCQAGEGVGDHGPHRVALSLIGGDDGVLSPIPRRGRSGGVEQDVDRLPGGRGGQRPP